MKPCQCWAGWKLSVALLAQGSLYEAHKKSPGLSLSGQMELRPDLGILAAPILIIETTSTCVCNCSSILGPRL